MIEYWPKYSTPNDKRHRHIVPRILKFLKISHGDFDWCPTLPFPDPLLAQYRTMESTNCRCTGGSLSREDKATKMVCSAIFIMDTKGKTIISKNYRGMWFARFNLDQSSPYSSHFPSLHDMIIRISIMQVIFPWIVRSAFHYISRRKRK